MASSSPRAIPGDRAVPAGLWRRLAALLYDALLLLAVLFVATALLLPLNQGEAFRPGQWAYPLYLLAVSFLFLAWSWTHGGQTLGMRAWHIRVVGGGDNPVTWPQAMRRFAAGLVSLAPAGAGFLWMVVDREGLAWHDRLSGTRVVRE